MPMFLPRKRARSSSLSFCRSSPATTTEPPSARSRPVITISSVDLPDPDGPSRPTAWPRPIFRSMSLRICTRAAPRPSERLIPLSTTASPAKGSLDVSFMSAADQRLSRLMRGRSYGYALALRQMACAVAAALLYAALLAGLTVAPPAFAAAPVKIVALGDSLTAGLGLPRDDGFVPRLQAALAEKGIAAQLENAGVSGDTTSAGLARLDWSVPPGTDGVIIELGANDMLRGIDPQVTYAALDGI